MATYFCWDKVHFCTPCHDKWTDNVEYQGKNKKRYWQYPNCAGIVQRSAAIMTNPDYTDDDLRESAFSLLQSDPLTCPLLAKHPPHGIEFGIGCTMCRNQNLKTAEGAALAVAAAAAAVVGAVVPLGANPYQPLAMQPEFELLYNGRVSPRGVNNGQLHILDIFHYLGTCAGTQEYVNPHVRGLCQVSMPHPGRDSEAVPAVLDREHRAARAPCVSSAEGPVAQNVIEFRFLRHRVGVTHYRLRNAPVDVQMLEWRFQARDSLEDVWVTLQTVDRMGVSGMSAWLPVMDLQERGDPTPYRFFRLQCTGKNSAGAVRLYLGGIELFGRVVKV